MSDRLPFDDDVELRAVRRPAGSHRSRSAGTVGAERDLLRDSSGALLGPTESFPVDLEELRKALTRRSPGKRTAVDIATDVAYLVVREALAQVYHLVIVPKARAKWSALKQTRRSERRHVSHDASGSELIVADLGQVDEPSTNLVSQPPTTVMSSDEFRKRFALMLAADNFAVEQRRLLSTAQICDETDPPPQLMHAMKLVLEEDTASLDDVSLQLLVDFLISSEAEPVGPDENDDGAMAQLETPSREE